MNYFKLFNRSFYIVILFICLMLMGCSNSANSIMSDAIDNMTEDITSYYFNGSATMNLGGIQGSGEVVFDGKYQAPNQIYMNMDMGIMDKSQTMEILIDEKNRIFTRINETDWQPYIAPPNLSNFQQPGQNQNASAVLKTIDVVADEPEIIGTEKINGIKVIVIRVPANPEKLKEYISDELTNQSRASEEQKKTIETLIDNMSISQTYKIYIEEDTSLIHRVDLQQKTQLTLDNQEATIGSNMVFNYYDFNQTVKIPQLPNLVPDEQ